MQQTPHQLRTWPARDRALGHEPHTRQVTEDVALAIMLMAQCPGCGATMTRRPTGWWACPGCQIWVELVAVPSKLMAGATHKPFAGEEEG